MNEQPNIIISRDGAQYGPYTLQQVKDYLAAGNFLPNDFAWDGKHFEWITVTELVAGTPPPAPVKPLIFTPAEPVAPPVTTPVQERKRGIRLRKGPRNVFLLIAMFFIWWYVMYAAASFLIVFGVATFAGPNATDLNQADNQQFAENIHLAIGIGCFVAFLLSLGLTVTGKLPGTGRPLMTEDDFEERDDRNPVLLGVMAVIYWIVMAVVLLVVLAIAIMIANGIFEFGDPQLVEQACGRFLAPLIFFGPLALSIWLTINGYLPGTRK